MGAAFDVALSFSSEDQGVVEKVYHYLKAEGLKVFFAPSQEAQVWLSGKNQREAFYSIFGLEADYAALFVSQNYLQSEVAMEEANIALSKHNGDGKVIPIYLDDAALPRGMFDPQDTNYFRSANPVTITGHLAARIKLEKQGKASGEAASSGSVMNIEGNTASRQVFIQNFHGREKP